MPVNDCSDHAFNGSARNSGVELPDNLEVGGMHLYASWIRRTSRSRLATDVEPRDRGVTFQS